MPQSELRSEETRMEADFYKRISIDPKVMVGKPVIAGTRIPVEMLVRMVGQGIPDSEILEDFPHITVDDIRAAVLYAAALVANEEIHPLQTV